MSDRHAAYWRERIAAMSDAELSKWIFGVARDKAKANSAVVIDRDRHGEWPVDAVEKAANAWAASFGFNTFASDRRAIRDMFDALASVEGVEPQ